MTGVEGQRTSADDTHIGLLGYFQDVDHDHWQSHADQHALEDKALQLAVHGMQDELRSLQALLGTRIDALATVVAANDEESRLRADARRERFEQDETHWRAEHQRMHDVLREVEDRREQDRVATLIRMQADKNVAHHSMQEHFEETFAQWRTDHQHLHDTVMATTEQRGQEWMHGLRELMDVKERAHQTNHLDSQRAIDIADKSMTEKLQEMNQLRQQITAERGTYVNRDMLDARMTSATVATTSLSKTNETRLASLERSQNIAYGVLIVLVFAIPLGLKFIP